MKTLRIMTGVSGMHGTPEGLHPARRPLGTAKAVPGYTSESEVSRAKAYYESIGEDFELFRQIEVLDFNHVRVGGVITRVEEVYSHVEWAAREGYGKVYIYSFETEEELYTCCEWWMAKEDGDAKAMAQAEYELETGDGAASILFRRSEEWGSQCDRALSDNTSHTAAYIQALGRYWPRDFHREVLERMAMSRLDSPVRDLSIRQVHQVVRASDLPPEFRPLDIPEIPAVGWTVCHRRS